MLRRDFIRNTLYASTMAAVAGKVRLRAETPPKRILVLGGTFFLGPAFVDAALADGHTVTLFNRGVTNPELFPFVEKLRGFRSVEIDDQNLSALGRRHWDVVIDVWPHDPALVESAAKLLTDRTKHYLYVSSIGAYNRKNYAQPDLTEDAPIAAWDGPGSSYTRGKAESERRLRAVVGEKLTIVRPGPIKGVRDDTPDILIWLRRLQNAHSVIAPGNGDTSVEIVDVKDVADFLILAIDHSLYGTFNLTGRPMSFREFLDGCKSATHSDAELVWIPETILREQGLAPQDLPNWLLNFPYWEVDPLQRGFAQISSKKAFDAGWETRPFRNTALDYLSYVASLNNYVFQDTLPPSRQEEVLNLWRNRTK
jgi:2'-hydroxyisoflavone reductase